MRETLFRGKGKDDGNWYEGYYLQLHDTTYCCMPSDNVDEANRLNKENEHHYIVFEQMTDWGLPNKHLRAEVLPETVCQYTGLTDKNGRKIFDGYICRDSDNIVRILWNDKHQWGVEISKTDNVLSRGLVFPLWQYDNCKENGYRTLEVIGNIFDNPELIGEQP